MKLPKMHNNKRVPTVKLFRRSRTNTHTRFDGNTKENSNEQTDLVRKIV